MRVINTLLYLKLIIILITIAMSINSCRFNCKKSLITDKKRNPTENKALGPKPTIKSGRNIIYKKHSKSLDISFEYYVGKYQLEIRSNGTSDTRNIKARFVIGPAVKIALVFEDDSIQNIEFNKPEWTITERTDGSQMIITSNKVTITEKQFKKYLSKKIKKVQVLNPYDDSNESTVEIKELDERIQKRIMFVAGCFYDKINNKFSFSISTITIYQHPLIQ